MYRALEKHSSILRRIVGVATSTMQAKRTSLPSLRRICSKIDREDMHWICASICEVSQSSTRTLHSSGLNNDSGFTRPRIYSETYIGARIGQYERPPLPRGSRRLIHESSNRLLPPRHTLLWPVVASKTRRVGSF